MQDPKSPSRPLNVAKFPQNIGKLQWDIQNTRFEYVYAALTHNCEFALSESVHLNSIVRFTDRFSYLSSVEFKAIQTMVNASPPMKSNSFTDKHSVPGVKDELIILRDDPKYREGGLLYLVGNADVFWTMICVWHKNRTTGVKYWDKTLARISLNPNRRNLIDCMFYCTPYGCHILGCEYLHSPTLKKANEILYRNNPMPITNSELPPYLIFHTIKSGKLAEALILIDDFGVNGNEVGSSGLNTALRLAAKHGQVDVAKILVAAGVSPSGREFENTTPLHVAALHNSVGIIKFLLSFGINVNGNKSTKNHKSPLHLACRRGHDGAVTLLLESGADVNSQPLSNIAYTPLHYAVKGGHLSTAQLLVESGADLNRLGGIYLETPLHFAAKYKQLEIAALLVNNGAVCTVSDTLNRQPIEYVLKYSVSDKKFLSLLFWNTEDTRILPNLWMKAFNQGHTAFCWMALVENDGRLDIWNKRNSLTKMNEMIHRFEIMMFKWILRGINSFTIKIPPDLYNFIEAFI
ncbi:hypothetical protein HK098_004764 [Nowakowskiella sp. JEL0407]|nr:hypothetical protein HK098_004764 [Nowakowskiella sp. JEL0407]